MDGTYTVVMGDRGRMVVPAGLRARRGWHEGSTLVFVETPDGDVLMSREQLHDLVSAELAGPDLADQLVAERRAALDDEG